MALKLRIVPDPVLRKLADPVKTVDAQVSRFMHEMLEAMYTSNGVGLAAPQVGELKRVIVVDVAEEQDPAHAFMMADPEITWRSEELFTYREGCLSIPGQYAEVTRPKRIKLSYTDVNNKRVEMEAEDLLSTCIQHEIDHLNGVLFIDYVSKLKRDMMLKRVEKIQRLAAEEEQGGKVL
ncbi:MAG: peptide deformylase [Alphaproteobacteria bacterium]|nr:peptide deformylase [Alphaproteobacteria bacterium]